VMMTATWCGWCKVLEKETLSDPWVRHFLSGFVLVKAYEDRAVEQKYGLSGYPTLVFTDSAGKSVHKTVGHQAQLPFSRECARAESNTRPDKSKQHRTGSGRDKASVTG